MATVGVTSGLGLTLNIAALVCFLVCLATVLFIFTKNAGYLLSVAKGLNKNSKALKVADHLAPTTFGLGFLLFAFILIHTAAGQLDTVAAKRDAVIKRLDAAIIRLDAATTRLDSTTSQLTDKEEFNGQRQGQHENTDKSGDGRCTCGVAARQEPRRNLAVQGGTSTPIDATTPADPTTPADASGSSAREEVTR